MCTNLSKGVFSNGKQKTWYSSTPLRQTHVHWSTKNARPVAINDLARKNNGIVNLVRITFKHVTALTTSAAKSWIPLSSLVISFFL